MRMRLFCRLAEADDFCPCFRKNPLQLQQENEIVLDDKNACPNQTRYVRVGVVRVGVPFHNAHSSAVVTPLYEPSRQTRD